MTGPDPRVTPARGDLAAKHLEGKVEAGRFVEGRVMEVAVGFAPLRHAPDDRAILDSELLLGERFTVYEEKDGWAWGQSAIDDYVGYVPEAALRAPGPKPTHRVSALSSHLFPVDDFKRPPLARLPMGARVCVITAGRRFVEVACSAGLGFIPSRHLTPLGEWADDYVAVACSAGLGFIPSRHLTPLGEWADDYVAVALKFLGAPYLWGGRTLTGLDCSALVQLALAQAGQAAPRDSDQQLVLGEDLTTTDLAQVERGDLLFWGQHVTIAIDQRRMVHANASTMAVTIDDSAEFAARVAAVDGPITAIRRVRS
jgi:cell wall-associated NlpC family hydrolase